MFISNTVQYARQAKCESGALFLNELHYNVLYIKRKLQSWKFFIVKVIE